MFILIFSFYGGFLTFASKKDTFFSNSASMGVKKSEFYADFRYEGKFLKRALEKKTFIEGPGFFCC